MTCRENRGKRHPAPRLTSAGAPQCRLGTPRRQRWPRLAIPLRIGLIRLSMRSRRAGRQCGMSSTLRPGRDRPSTPRLLRELRTLEVMTEIYCRDQHGRETPCERCRELLNYAAKRLAVCPFGEDKPVCAKCQIHCYGPASREEVRIIMRYAGPRMMLRHPWLALGHLLDKRYPAPAKPRARQRA